MAERDGLDAIPFPEDLLKRRDDPRVSEIIENEQRVFGNRLRSFQDQSKSLESRLARHQEEIVELEAQQQSANKKHRIMQARLRDIRRLAEQGTIPKVQALQLEISAATIEQEIRKIAVAIIGARRAITQADQALLEADEPDKLQPLLDKLAKKAG